MIIPRNFNPSKSCIQFDAESFGRVLTWPFGDAIFGDKNAAKNKQQAAEQAANAKAEQAIVNSPKVENTPASASGSEKDSNAARIGRSALISTSPLGVQTTDPTGRRKLLGNV